MTQSNDVRVAVVEPSQVGTSNERDASLTQAMNEYLEALEAGQPADREALLERYPVIADELVSCLDGIDFIHQVAPQLGETKRQEARGDSSERRPATALGDYRILREIGRGGMGVVYEAEQLSLRRRVALKVLPFASVMDQRQIARFKNEAQAAGLLQHTNIVPVYGVGCERGVHYFAMQYIEGMTLAEVIQELSRVEGRESRVESQPGDQGELIGDRLAADVSPTAEYESPKTVHRLAVSALSTSPIAQLSTERSAKPQEYIRTIARIGIQAAEALDHAHKNGILHRDVKPGNLMLDMTGNVWVTDFGLARMEGNPQMTMTGDVVGTLRYMSPEQALAKRVIVDHRSDIYSLGVTLYELLTLRPAFEGSDRGELLRQIADEDPRPLRSFDKSIPAEFGTIVFKALAKNPLDRYATAQELADDLRRLLMHEPVKARRPSLVHKARKWVRRHRSLVYSAVACMIATSLILAGSIGWIVRDQGIRRLEVEGRVADALNIAEPILREGNAHHPELVSAARKAEAQLASALVSPALDRRVHKMRSDLAMLEALEEARLARSAVSQNHFDLTTGAAEYAKAFREYGIDIQMLSPDVAAASVRDRTISLQLAAALDDWASLLLGRARREEAKHLLAVARQVDPDIWRNRLRAALESSDRNVLSELAREARVDSLPVATLVLLGGTLLNRQMRPEAAELLKRAQPHFPGDFWINQDLGIALMLSNQARLDEAAGYLRTAIALRPQSPGARLNLGYALKESGRLDEAIAEYQEAVRLKPDYDGALNELGDTLLSRGRPEEAIPHLKEAIRVQPKSSSLQLILGYSLLKVRRFDEAITAFQEAIKLSPDSSNGYNGLGSVLLEQGLREEGLSTMQKGLALEEKRVTDSPRDFGFRHNLAGMQNNVAMILMEHGEKKRDYRKFTDASKYFAMISMKDGEKMEAESLLRRAIETESQLLLESPTNRLVREYLANMHKNLGQLLHTLGKHVQAELEVRNSLTHRKQLIVEVPTHVEYRADTAHTHAALASVLIDQKKFEEAESQFSHAIAILKQLVAEFPSTPGHRFDLAVIHHDHTLKLKAQDKHADAQAECQQAISLLKQLVTEFPSRGEYDNRLADCRMWLLSELNLTVFVTSDPSILKNSADLAFGPDRNGDQVKDLYVVGRNSNNVVIYDGKTGAFIEEFLGPASGLNNAAWLTFGPDSALFISTRTTSGNRDAVMRVDQKTKSVSMFVSSDNPGGNGGLLGAAGMAFGPDGHFYVASRDTHEVLRFNGSNGGFMDVFVHAGSGGLDKPINVLFGRDRNNDMVDDLYVISIGTAEVLAYSGIDGSPLGVFIAAVSGGLKGPHDMEFGPDGHLYVVGKVSVSDSPRVFRFDGASGNFIDIAIPSGLAQSTSFIAFDSQGDLYVSSESEHEVLCYRGQRGHKD